MHILKDLRKQLEFIQEKIGYLFGDQELLVLALTHRSFVNEHKREVRAHNERLEFLGDSVLGLVMAEFLYHRLPDMPEGPLSQYRSRLVDAQSCAHSLQALGLAEFILLGRGEALDGKAKTSILADAFEAIVGAIFLDGGFAAVKSWLVTSFAKEIEAVLESPLRNYKAELQDLSQKQMQKTPIYRVEQETGPDHAKVFHVVVLIEDKEMGTGVGESKKQAEQQAAFDALSKLRMS